MSVLARGLAFGLSISITSLLTSRCGSLSDLSPKGVPLQPPNWVFGVVWPILFVTTGVAWAMAGSDADLMLGAVTLLCCSWLVVYTCLRQKAVAAVVLLLTVAATVAAAVQVKGTPGWLLSPLALWTAFASYLNVYDAKSAGS